MIRQATSLMLSLSVMALATSAPLPAAATAYRSYVNARYGYAICYPPYKPRIQSLLGCFRALR